MTFYAEFTKKLILFSLFIPRLFFEIRVISVAEPFLRRGRNSLKRTYAEGGRGGGVKRTGTNKGGRGQKLEISSERTFSMTPYCDLMYTSFNENIRQQALSGQIY